MWRWQARWRRAALLHDQQRHVRGEMKRYVKNMSVFMTNRDSGGGVRRAAVVCGSGAGGGGGVIGHDIGGKYIPIMARLIKVRHWSKR